MMAGGIRPEADSHGAAGSGESPPNAESHLVLDRGLVHPEPAPRFSRTPGASQAAAPLVGEHTAAVLASAGFSEPGIAGLRASGAVFQAQQDVRA
jgi:crotonobetainyl-CoA:carnitine CoA-transferase CaiB-like acyl-CoA transferase